MIRCGRCALPVRPRCLWPPEWPVAKGGGRRRRHGRAAGRRLPGAPSPRWRRVSAGPPRCWPTCKRSLTRNAASDLQCHRYADRRRRGDGGGRLACRAVHGRGSAMAWATNPRHQQPGQAADPLPRITRRLQSIRLRGTAATLREAQRLADAKLLLTRF